MNTPTLPWHGRRVLVTGCTGLLGSAVTRELLRRGAEVVGLVRDRAGGAQFVADPRAEHFRVWHGRAEDAARLHAAMAVHEVSAVFHLASTDAACPDRGTPAVLRAAGLYHPRIPVVAARPGGQLRVAAGRDEPVTAAFGVARFGELFGSGDRNESRVVPRTVIGLVTGDPVPLPSPGPARDFVFARDAAWACLAVAEAVGNGGGPLDLTFRSGWTFTERDMAARVADVIAGREPAADDPPPNPLGWCPEVPLAEALRETVEWYRANARGPKPSRVAERRAA